MLEFHPLTMSGAFVVDTKQFVDHRGAFVRAFCDCELYPILGERRIVQINLSRTVMPGAIRGMHFQYAPHAEMKMVRCLRGRVLDVVLDLRTGSPTQFSWHGEELSRENGRMLVIPEGCAHGFQALEPDAELLYLHTAPYTPASEGGVRYDDPRLSIVWPLPVTDLSQRDANHALITDEFRGILL